MVLATPQALKEYSTRKDVQEAVRTDPDTRLALMRQATTIMQILRSATAQPHQVIGQARDIEDLGDLQALWQRLIDEEFGGKYRVVYTHSKMTKAAQVGVGSGLGFWVLGCTHFKMTKAAHAGVVFDLGFTVLRYNNPR